MLHLNNINLNEKQIFKMIDLGSMKSMILFMGSNLECLTYPKKEHITIVFIGTTLKKKKMPGRTIGFLERFF